MEWCNRQLLVRVQLEGLRKMVQMEGLRKMVQLKDLRKMPCLGEVRCLLEGGCLRVKSGGMRLRLLMCLVCVDGRLRFYGE